VRFSIITPSYRNSTWLRLCIASVADQEVAVEHIVQDAESDDGTLDWLPQDSRVRPFVEKDAGMYDAINRGIRRATGDVLAWLNCDEQYLPGALRAVGEYFEQHPDVDVVFGDAVMVDAAGEYLFHRKVLVPQLYHTWICHLAVPSCATFFRRRLLDAEGTIFDPSFRVIGDADWILRLIQHRVRMGAMRRFMAAFTIAGTNLSLNPRAQEEHRWLVARAPRWAARLRPWWVAHHRLRRLVGGIYSQEPFSFALYTQQSPARRLERRVERPTFRWRW